MAGRICRENVENKKKEKTFDFNRGFAQEPSGENSRGRAFKSTRTDTQFYMSTHAHSCTRIAISSIIITSFKSTRAIAVVSVG